MLLLLPASQEDLRVSKLHRWAASSKKKRWILWCPGNSGQVRPKINFSYLSRQQPNDCCLSMPVYNRICCHKFSLVWLCKTFWKTRPIAPHVVCCWLKIIRNILTRARPIWISSGQCWYQYQGWPTYVKKKNLLLKCERPWQVEWCCNDPCKSVCSFALWINDYWTSVVFAIHKR